MRRGSRKMSSRARGLTGERFGEYRETIWEAPRDCGKMGRGDIVGHGSLRESGLRNVEGLREVIGAYGKVVWRYVTMNVTKINVISLLFLLLLR